MIELMPEVVATTPSKPFVAVIITSPSVIILKKNEANKKTETLCFRKAIVEAICVSSFKRLLSYFKKLSSITL
ncbi:hypothetical protein GCM10008967_25000 [Bacillus carboniphilus]|uniref:Uncharacterized protein n=1 Tax=Bacillus carboniphilus TaxID=86663 RepID=A0ABP3G659_9BACI